jgi:phosphate transport system permease protein
MNTNSSFVLSIRQWRMLKDQIAKYSMTLGGISIIIAITLIFFYLLYVVLPLFLPASMNHIVQFNTSDSIYIATEEKNETSFAVADPATEIMILSLNLV